MSKDEIVWVPQGTNEKIEALARKLGLRKGRSPRSPGGRLLVIERKLNVPGNSKQELWMQIIFNPWEFEEYEPIIDLLNVDSRRLPGFTLINETEGRFRWDNRSKWRRGDKANLYTWFEDILNSDIHNATPGIKTRPNAPQPQAGMRFPYGVQVLEERLMRIAKEDNITLRTEAEYLQHLEFQRLEKEKEEQKKRVLEEKRKLAIEQLQVSIQTAETLDDLEGFEETIPNDIASTNDGKNILKLLNERREQLEPKLDDFPDFDDQKFTTDTTIAGHGTRRKRKGVREFDNV